MSRISEYYRRLRAEIPSAVTIVLAAKTRTPEEIREAIDAGAGDIGYNYVQEGAAMKAALGDNAGKVRWHLIGHLQSNKIKSALDIFDTIQTVDSAGRAGEISRRATSSGRAPVPILLEINTACEPNKHGFAPEIDAVAAAVQNIISLEGVELRGLMTMGPAEASAEQLRPYFRATRTLRDQLAERFPAVRFDTLSMGMSDSYRAAIEEGATMVRLGTVVFGER